MLWQWLIVLTLTIPGFDLPRFATFREYQNEAMRLDILDRSECKYWLTTDREFAGDMALLRDRWQRVGNAPPSWDAIRFPCRKTCEGALRVNHEMRDWLEQRQWLDSSPWVREAIADCEYREQVWETALYLLDDWRGKVSRREQLAKLRDLIGDADYYAGCLPGPIPAWHLRRID